MGRYQIGRSDDLETQNRSEAADRDDDPGVPGVPPAVIGFLLLLTVVLACAFYIAAQVVQTP
jgi:hypothetical protein